MPMGGTVSTWSNPQDSGVRSGRQRTTRVVPRKRPLSMASYLTSATSRQAQRHPRLLPALSRPAVRCARHHCSLGVGGGIHPLRPGMLARVGQHVGGEFVDQFPPSLGGEAGRHAAVVQPAIAVVQAHDQRADALAVDVHPVSGDGDVEGPCVLDLELRPLVGLVDPAAGLGDQPVEPCALEALVPAAGEAPVEGRGRQMHRRLESARHRFQHGPPVAERLGHEVGVGRGQHVESHELRRRLDRQPVDPALSRVDPLLQGVEAEPVVDAHDDLAVHHRPLGQHSLQRLDQLGEVAGQGPLVAAAQHQLVAVAEHDAAKAVPLRLEGQIAVRNALHRPGQHRPHRRHHRQIHATEPRASTAMQPAVRPQPSLGLAPRCNPLSGRSRA